MSDYFSDEMVEIKSKRDKMIGNIEQLEIFQERFKKIIENEIKHSTEIDGTGNVWINSFSLLEALGLSDWNIKRNEKISESGDLINKFNEKDALSQKSEVKE